MYGRTAIIEMWTYRMIHLTVTLYKISVVQKFASAKSIN